MRAIEVDVSAVGAGFLRDRAAELGREELSRVRCEVVKTDERVGLASAHALVQVEQRVARCAGA